MKCPNCRNANTPMGALGSTTHYRCRACGWQYSKSRRPAMKIHFTALQAGEIAHKACIVRDEPDLLESYELTQDQASELADAFLAAQHGGDVDVWPDWVDVIVGEIDNSIEIAQANQDVDGPGTHLAYIKSMRSLQAKVRSANPEGS